jgi:hypothetical protein
MTIPARPTLENMFQFPVFCFSEDGSSHFAPNRWNDDPEWNTLFELGWDGEENTLQYTFFYHYIWNYPTFSWGTSQHPHVRSLFPKHIPNRTPISKAKKDRTWVHWSSYFDKHIQSTFSIKWLNSILACCWLNSPPSNLVSVIPKKLQRSKLHS